VELKVIWEHVKFENWRKPKISKQCVEKCEDSRGAGGKCEPVDAAPLYHVRRTAPKVWNLKQPYEPAKHINQHKEREDPRGLVASIWGSHLQGPSSRPSKGPL